MTPSPKSRATRRNLLALALASCVANPAVAQQPTTESQPPAPQAPSVQPQAGAPAPAAPAATQPPQPSSAATAAFAPVSPAGAASFTVSDIRVDGLQRIGAGTVFTYLPIERGDTVDQARIAEAIRALYKSAGPNQPGFFEDVRISREGNILVVTVVERPAINKLTLSGNKDLKTEDLTKGLADIGLAEGNTYDRLALDRVTQELTRQYNNRGKYNVQITPSVTRLDRNRVDLTLTIDEGKAAKIRHVNLIGNDKFEQDEILDSWESKESNWLSWYRRDDQYSREKLEGDREKLRNFYLDRGYIDFAEDSIQVAISPDKRDMFITAGLTEGEPYTVSSVEISGDTVLPKEEIEKRLLVREGQTFSRALLELTSDSITNSLGNIGYAFAQVNPIPSVDRDKRTVAINLQVVPGPRVNVRRIVFKGNTRTSDEVMRREMRQFEGSWYSQAAVDRSKVRLQQLGFFESGSVEVETQPVQGSSDQVDVVFNVKETTSGSFVFGLGYSQLTDISTSIQLSQNNFLGSGNRVSVEANRNAYLQRYAFSFLNPYFTDNGMSLGYNLSWREFDNSDRNIASYSSTSRQGQVVAGLPITEFDTVSAAFGIDSNQIFTFDNSTPEVIRDYIKALGQRTFHAWRWELGWARDTRNDYFAPTRGMYQRASVEVALPGSTVEYFKLSYEVSKYWPLSRALVLNTRAELGYGDSYGDAITRNLCFTPTRWNDADKDGVVDEGEVVEGPAPSEPCLADSPDYKKTVTADGLPFFENFYAGGVRSIRGFRDNTVGPRAGINLTGAGSAREQPIGGAVKTVGSLEMIFPTLLDTPSARVSAFVDFGNVFADTASWDAGELRASAGIALLWRAPVGPISISYAIPLRKKDAIRDDDGALIEEGDEIERLQFTFGGAF